MSHSITNVLQVLKRKHKMIIISITLRRVREDEKKGAEKPGVKESKGWVGWSGKYSGSTGKGGNGTRLGYV